MSNRFSIAGLALPHGVACIVLVLLTACQTPPGRPDDASPPAQKTDGKTVAAPQPPKEPPPPPVDYGQLALQEGLDLYRRGDFAGAYRRLQESPDIASSSVDTQAEALKYAAFAACAQNKRTQCRQTFEQLLAVQPTFELKDAEAKHPIWGPIFRQVKQAQGKQAPGGAKRK